MAKHARASSDAEEGDRRAGTRPAPAGLDVRNGQGGRGDGRSPSSSPAVCPAPSSVDGRDLNNYMPRYQPTLSEELDYYRHPSPLAPAKSEINFSTWNYPPEFYDSLSQIDLTELALRELDRRNDTLPPLTETFHPTQTAGDCFFDTQSLEHLRQYARHGGPDMSDVRNFPDLTPYYQLGPFIPDTDMERPTAGAYDKRFLQNLIDGGVYPDMFQHPKVGAFPKPDNWAAIQTRLSIPRSDISCQTFSEEMHYEFQMANAGAARELLTSKLTQMIEGFDSLYISGRSGGVIFSNLDSLTGGLTAPAYPDIYYGATPYRVSRRVRTELNGTIVPSRQADLPVLPNFFLEMKGPGGTYDVLLRQILNNGALGARAMHSIRSYGQEQPISDNNAYTISSGYIGGHLLMYTIHRVQRPGHTPEYVTHLLGSWSMTSDAETFRKGATCYRNARDWAEEQRNEAIGLANARAEELSNREQK